MRTLADMSARAEHGVLVILTMAKQSLAMSATECGRQSSGTVKKQAKLLWGVGPKYFLGKRGKWRQMSDEVSSKLCGVLPCGCRR